MMMAPDFKKGTHCNSLIDQYRVMKWPDFFLQPHRLQRARLGMELKARDNGRLCAYVGLQLFEVSLVNLKY